MSEDTKSFHDVLDVDNKRVRLRHKWIYDAEEKHNKEMVRRAEPLAAEADIQMIESRKDGKNIAVVYHYRQQKPNLNIFYIVITHIFQIT